jgi:RimJ/RimL family protein N-acetyltransferase
MTLSIPHPYPDGAAEQWIATHTEAWESGHGVTLAITQRDSGHLVGAISLMDIRRDHQRGEIGYWIGKPYWNRGYATEATRALIRFGFQELDLNRIQATHLPQNPASGRVMEKAGMQYEGTLRQYVKRDHAYKDMCMRSILRHDEG